jgi:regulator of RNase E activity RraA
MAGKLPLDDGHISAIGDAIHLETRSVSLAPVDVSNPGSHCRQRTSWKRASTCPSTCPGGWTEKTRLPIEAIGRSSGLGYPQIMESGIASQAIGYETGLLAHIEEHLYTAVVSDTLDDLGYRHQAMREYLRPLAREFRFAGWARTIYCVDVYHISDDPYGKEIEAVDSIRPDEVVVISTGQSKRNAPWGELLSTAARARGARGAIVDGLVRDVEKIRSLGFPVFAAGIKPVDSKGRGLVAEYNVPVECGEVSIVPGDLVFADYDGVVVVPAALVDETVRIATDKVCRENSTREELLGGAYLRDVYNKYGVL